ncbi:Uncharacterised protein [Mycobacteroides abscessus subsp. abscessus]|nr:Uncharacterised protein [Mycobacteroides abscessus subsp. abscessus]
MDNDHVGLFIINDFIHVITVEDFILQDIEIGFY